MTDIAKNNSDSATATKMELANRLFFRLYQCANMLHKTGSRAVEAEGSRPSNGRCWAPVSRKAAEGGMSVGDLARYLMVSRQNLAGLIGRMERDGHLAVAPDTRDRRSRIVTMTEAGRHVWRDLALPKIHAYYGEVLAISRSTTRLTYCTISSRSLRTCSASTRRLRTPSRRSRTQQNSRP